MRVCVYVLYTHIYNNIRTRLMHAKLFAKLQTLGKSRRHIAHTLTQALSLRDFGLLAVCACVCVKMFSNIHTLKFSSKGWQRARCDT